MRMIKLMLIDDDSIFRLGLVTALAAFGDLQIVAEADSLPAALEMLASRAGTQSAADLVVLELSLNRLSPARGEPDGSPGGLELCQQLKTQYPTLPILLLCSPAEPSYLAAARAIGVDGYCPKGTPVSVIVQAMRQVANGVAYWGALPAANLSTQSPRNLPTWHHRQRQSGLRQIDSALAEATSVLQNPHLSMLDWLFWSGRQRELRAARWLVNQLLPGEIVILQPVPNTPELRALSLEQAEESEKIPHSTTPQPSGLFDTTLANIQLGVENLTGSPLEIDILRAERKRELLALILRQLEAVLDELRFSQVQPVQLPQKLPVVVRDLWQASTTDFFGKYYTLPVGNREYEVVNILLQDAAIVKGAILDKIPLLVDLFAYLLYETPIAIDNAAYAAQTPEAIERAEALLQNLILQVANAVVQPLLNHLADVEIIKQSFYDRRLISSREIARLRNDLSWKYRLEQYIVEPKAIFESRYNLLVLGGRGIRKMSIYAPRREELEQLTGIQLAVSLGLETRDAIAPRLRAIVSSLGSSVIYVLTQVIGRGIGLIGRGIIQGVGSSLQSTRFGKNGERRK